MDSKREKLNLIHCLKFKSILTANIEPGLSVDLPAMILPVKGISAIK